MYLFEASNTIKNSIKENSFEAQSRAMHVIKSIAPHAVDIKLYRAGSKNDGGYLIADDLMPTDHLISFGVGDNVDFEVELANKIASTELYDHTIQKMPVSVPNSTLTKKKVVGVASEANHITLQNAADLAKSGGRTFLLKMDIEGWEWDVLEYVSSSTLSKFRQIVVELHWTDRLLNDEAYKKMLIGLAKLNKHHRSVNVNANNWSGVNILGNIFLPEVLEVTFLNKSYYNFSKIAEGSYRSWELNNPCNKNKPQIWFPYVAAGGQP